MNASSHIIRTANQLGILKSLRDGQKTAAEIAEMCQLNVDALERFLKTLVHTKLVEHYGEYFALAQVAKLIPDELGDLGDNYWKFLGSYLCTGQSLPDDSDNAASEDDFLISAAANEWMLTPAAMAAAQALEIGTGRQGLRILELGCGTAVFSAALAHVDPDCQIVLADTSQRLNQAQQTVNSVGLEDRVQFVATDDYTQVELPGETFPMVVIAGVLHRHGPEIVAEWLQRVGRLVAPGGEVCIVDVFPGQEQGDRYRAIYELELALRTSQGTAHDPLTIQANLSKAGFHEIQFAKLPVQPHLWGLILATKQDRSGSA